MVVNLFFRMLREVGARRLFRFVWSFGLRGALGIRRFKKRLAAGINVPPFWFISVTSRCNLSCQGCWVRSDNPVDMPPADIDRIISEGKRFGNYFFGILGGEPLLYDRLLEIIGRHRDCYFQLFTNGVNLTPDVATMLAELGNVTPLISIEGDEQISDIRRGGKNVYGRSLAALENCHRAGLITGVASSICQSNYDSMVRREFVDKVASLGAHYLWYYIYRPVGPEPAPELALTREQILGLRRFMVDARPDAPLAIIDSYWDAEGRAFCPAAEKLSIHINPLGDIEPCPPVQFARDNIHDSDNIVDILKTSKFLDEFGRAALSCGNGCILMDAPEKMLEFARADSVKPTSGRDGCAELAAMRKCPGHDMPGEEIPEKSWIYRIAKKYAFFGFGAYG